MLSPLLSAFDFRHKKIALSATVLIILLSCNLASNSFAQDQIYVYDDWSRGLNLKLSDFSLPKNQGTICENVRFNIELNAIAKRDQILGYGTADATEPITGMFRLYLSDGTKKLVVTHGDEVEVGDDDTGVFTTILDLSSGEHSWQFLAWHDILIGTDGHNQPIKWDGSSASATYLGSCLALDKGSGAGPDGTYTYKISYYTSSYEVLLDTPSNPVVVTDDDVSLSMIPIAPDSYGGESVIGRKVYRIKHAGSTYYLLSNGTIANNTATTLTDSDSDAQVSATVYPAGTETQKPPKCRFLVVNSNRLFLANDPTNGPSRIYRSKDASHDIFANTTDYHNIRLNDGDEITFAKNLLGILTIGKNNSIQKLYTKGDDPSADWEISDPFSFIGCQAPYSVVNSPLGIIYLSFDGIYKFNGQYSTLISEVVAPVINDIAETNYPDCWGEFHKNIYYLAYTSETTGAVANDRILLFDLLSNAYSIDILGRSVFCTFNSGTDYGVLYSGSSTNGEVFAHSETVHEVVHRKQSDLTGTFDDMRYIPESIGGNPDSPVLEISWSIAIDGASGTINSHSYGATAIIDRPDTDGTYISQILDINAFAFDRLYWNESIPSSGGDVTMAIRSAAASGDVTSASWSDEFTDPTGSNISGETSNRYVQYRISMDTDDINFTPTAYNAGRYVVKLTYDKEGETSEDTIDFRWESGWNDFGFPGQIKNLKKLYVYYESASSGTLNIEFENLEGDTDLFSIDLIKNPTSYVEYFTAGAFTGEFIKLKINESSLDDITIKRIICVYSILPLV